MKKIEKYRFNKATLAPVALFHQSNRDNHGIYLKELL